MIRCLIVDDKPLAIDILTDYVAKVPFLELVQSTTNPLEAINLIMENHIDLLFLDIQMPELSGLQVMKIIQGRCKVILTTAYSEYALEGFDNDALDYLLKPISFERFYKAAQKAQLTIAPAPTNPSPILSSASGLKDANYIFVKTEYKLVRVDTSEIQYIEGMQNYVTIHTRTDKIMCLQSMKKTEEQLPPPHFLRVHKSYIAAVSKISSVERNRIFIGTEIIPLGDVYREDFFKTIEKS